jgi:hypothetical protein
MVRIACNYTFEWWSFQFCYLTNEGLCPINFFRRSEPAPSQYLNDANTDLTVRYLTDIEEKAQVWLQFKAGKDGNYSSSFDVSLPEEIKPKHHLI